MKKQTANLLEALRRRPMTTKEIRDQLGIGMPATRVFELKKEGYDVVTEMVAVKNRFGEECKVARYTLLQQNVKAAA